MQRRRCWPVALLLLLQGACASTGGRATDGAVADVEPAGVRERYGAQVGVPAWRTLGYAARSAARRRDVWLPLAGAVLIGISGQDDAITEWAVRKQPVFGSDAADDSDRLIDINRGAALITALAVPADGLGTRLGGMAVQALTVGLASSVTEGLKQVTRRERPNGRNRASLPSGHATRAAAASYLARDNLSLTRLNDNWQRVGRITLHGLAFATGWARVEANRHHPSDVLAGMAVGNFVAAFMQRAVFRGGARVAAEPLASGVALRVSLPLP